MGENDRANGTRQILAGASSGRAAKGKHFVTFGKPTGTGPRVMANRTSMRGGICETGMTTEIR